MCTENPGTVVKDLGIMHLKKQPGFCILAVENATGMSSFEVF